MAQTNPNLDSDYSNSDSGSEEQRVTNDAFDYTTIQFLRPVDSIMNYYYFKEGFNKELLVKLDSQLSGIGPLINGNTSGVVNKSYRSSQIAWIPKTSEWQWVYDRMANLVRTGNDDLWHFDISYMNEEIQYTEYDAEYQGHYDWHVDVGGGKSSLRKISISVQLSEESDYEGGELQFYYKRDIITAPKNCGAVILFPSFMLHRVRPVTKGKRRCLVLWISGPPFR